MKPAASPFLALGVVLIFLGLLFTGQGIGWIGGSSMTDDTTWAVIGPFVALAGVVLVASALRMGRGADR
ncbi:MAG: hypothetical protein F2667_08520 [Actinobacteria bacterium]|uniref:Unannotated protein n=1 Tax=freshwater metagenome TaxID=449393 RepID=A0A6J6QTK5_9ZZZZ|nr:hypothetical protein [Actinomycetota bacterium]